MYFGLRVYDSVVEGPKASRVALANSVLLILDPFISPKEWAFWWEKIMVACFRRNCNQLCANKPPIRPSDFFCELCCREVNSQQKFEEDFLLERLSLKSKLLHFLSPKRMWWAYNVMEPSTAVCDEEVMFSKFKEHVREELNDPVLYHDRSFWRRGSSWREPHRLIHSQTWHHCAWCCSHQEISPFMDI